MKAELKQNEIEKLLQTWVQLSQQSKALAEQITAIKDTLKTHADVTGMENGDYFMGDTLKSRYDDLWKNKFDAKRLERENQDLYNKYLLLEYTHQVTVNNPQVI